MIDIPEDVLKRTVFYREFKDLNDCITTIKALENAVPVRRGKWIQVPHKRARICSECDCDEPYKFADEDTDVFAFCPHCGASMEISND